MSPSPFDPLLYSQDDWTSKKTNNGRIEPFSKLKSNSTRSFSASSFKLDTIPEDSLDLTSFDSNTTLESSLNSFSTLEKNKNDLQTLTSNNTTISSISPPPPSMDFSTKSKTPIELTACSTPTSIYTCLLDPRPYHVTKLFQSNSVLLDAIMNALEPGAQRDMFTKLLYTCRKTMPDLPWVHRLASFLYDVPPLLDSLLRVIGWVGGRISLTSLDFSVNSFTAFTSEALEELMLDSSSPSLNVTNNSMTPATRKFGFLGASSFTDLYKPVPTALSKKISTAAVSHHACSLLNPEATTGASISSFASLSSTSSTTSISGSRLLTKLNSSTSSNSSSPISNAFLPPSNACLLKKKTTSTIDFVSPMKKQMYSKLISHYSTTSIPPNLPSLPTSPFDTLPATGIASSIAIAEEGSANTLISNMVIPLT